MNERIVAIAQGLARGDRPSTLEGLAFEYGVSQRTIRNDIKSLNRYLTEKRAHSVGIRPRRSCRRAA